MTSIRAVPLADAGPALRDLLAELKRDDPLAPVTVAVPSNYAGLSLRRRLAAEGLPGSLETGLVNARFMALARAIEFLGAPRLAARGRTPIGRETRLAAIRAALADLPGDLGRAPATPAALLAIDATLRDLDAIRDPSPALESAGGRSAEVLALHREVRRRSAKHYDDRDLALAAAEAIEARDPALRDLGQVVLHLPGRLAPAQHTFLAALSGVGRLSAVLGLSGDAEVDEATLHGWRTLGLAADAPRAEVPYAGRVLAVPDPEEEVREVLRDLGARMLDGLPLHRAAILHRHDEPYASIAAEQLDAAGLPWNGASTRTLGHTVAGRALLGLLDLAARDLDRRAVVDWMNGAPIQADGRRAPSHRWEQIAKEAGIVRGAGQWAERLARHAEALETERHDIEKDERDVQWKLERIDRDLEQIDGLRRFVDELIERTGPFRPPQGGAANATTERWSSLASHARETLRRYLGGPPQSHATRAWPDADVEAYSAIEDALDRIGRLDDLGTPADAGSFGESVGRALERPAGRTGRFGHGVFVGRLADAAGTDFDVVYVIGMNEGAFPPAPREDPLLLDAERAAIGLPARRERQLDERRDYLAALAAGRERVLSYPRADVRGQRARLPSRWLLESASRLAGRTVFASKIEELGDEPWHAVLPSFESAMRGTRPPGGAQEYDLAALVRWRDAGRAVADHWLAREDAVIGRGVALQGARRSVDFTRWDGRVPDAAAASPFASGRPVSATALETWATCPAKYFFAHVLRVAERAEEPEDVLVISPLEKGTLIHTVLERFFELAAPRSAPDEPWSTQERALLRRIAEEECERAVERGVAGRPLLWESEREAILRDLDRFLDEDERLRRDHGAVQIASELSFGLDGHPPAAIDLGDGRTLLVRGRADRVDRSPDGARLVVFDYKTGGAGGYDDVEDGDAVVRGTKLQLPVYSAAALASAGQGAREVRTYYWFMTEKGGHRRIGYELREAQRERFLEVLRWIGDEMAVGHFPARPGPQGFRSPEHCTYCPYDEICPPGMERMRTWERKRTHPELASLIALAEPGEAGP